MKTWKTRLIINSFTLFLGNQEIAGNEEKALQYYVEGGNNFTGGSAIPAGPCPPLWSLLAKYLNFAAPAVGKGRVNVSKQNKEFEF